MVNREAAKREYGEWMNKHYAEYQACGREKDKGFLAVAECMEKIKGTKTAADAIGKYSRKA